MKIRYCLGFVFSQNSQYLLLIRKNRPAWAAGRLNGIGGKLEAGESPHDAMVRECQEETGLAVSDWTEFATLDGEGFEVVCFKAVSDDIFKAESLTDEAVGVFPVDFNVFFKQGNASVVPLVAYALRPEPTPVRLHTGESSAH